VQGANCLRNLDAFHNLVCTRRELFKKCGSISHFQGSVCEKCGLFCNYICTSSYTNQLTPRPPGNQIIMEITLCHEIHVHETPPLAYVLNWFSPVHISNPLSCSHIKPIYHTCTTPVTAGWLNQWTTFTIGPTVYTKFPVLSARMIQRHYQRQPHRHIPLRSTLMLSHHLNSRSTRSLFSNLLFDLRLPPSSGLLRRIRCSDTEATGPIGRPETSVSHHLTLRNPKDGTLVYCPSLLRIHKSCRQTTSTFVIGYYPEWGQFNPAYISTKYFTNHFAITF
jgi:hypothetical protein